LVFSQKHHNHYGERVAIVKDEVLGMGIISTPLPSVTMQH